MNAHGVNSWIFRSDMPSVLILGYAMVTDGFLIYTSLFFFSDKSSRVYKLKEIVICQTLSLDFILNCTLKPHHIRAVSDLMDL